MRHLASLIVVLAVTSLVLGQETPEEAKAKPKRHPTHDAGVEILKKVDAAAKAVKSVRYDGSLTGVDGTGKAFEIKGKVVVRRGTDGNPDSYIYDVHAKQGDDAESRRLTVGGNGDMYYLIHWEKKIAYEDLDPAVVGREGRTVMGIYMREFTHPTPFSDEINATGVEVRESAKVGDEDCYVIHVNYGARGQESTWYFSKKDYLPRQREMHNNRSSTPNVQTIMNLKIDGAVADDEFVLHLPDGFEKTDDFAPSALIAH